MTTLTIPVTLVAGANENVNDVVTNFNAIATWGNGNIDSTNIATSGVATANIAALAVTDAKIASANNSVYKTLLTSVGSLTGSGAATYVPLTTGATAANGTAANTTPIPIYRAVAADLLVGGLAAKLRVRAQVACNATAPAVTIVAGLYPVTVAGGAGVLNYTLGTVLSGSTVSLATPSASTITSGASTDVTLASNGSQDGAYALGFTLSGTMATNSIIAVSMQVQTRNT